MTDIGSEVLDCNSQAMERCGVQKCREVKAVIHGWKRQVLLEIRIHIVGAPDKNYQRTKTRPRAGVTQCRSQQFKHALIRRIVWVRRWLNCTGVGTTTILIQIFL
jgi:hypothetical protein